MRKGSIYIIKNKINNKVYIGQTIQSVEERFKQHLKPSTIKRRGSYKIYNAINKYGRENFYVEVLELNIDENKLDELEIYYINKFDSYKNGYNSTNGGDSKTISKIQDIEMLKNMFENKVHNKNIAKYFGVHPTTIQRTLESVGLKKINKVTKEFLLDNIELTNKEMARMLNVHPETISRAFKKFDIKRGRGCNNHKLPQNQKQINKV